MSTSNLLERIREYWDEDTSTSTVSPSQHRPAIPP